jgi:Uncharacterized conserved protein
MKYDVEARLPYLDLSKLTEEQQKFYDSNIVAMETMPYIWLTPDKELNGPSNAMLHDAEIGNLLFPLNRAMIKTSIERNGGKAHEVAVLYTVAGARAHYGMYAHTQLAKKFGLTDAQIAAVINGEKPAGLEAKESAAFDLAKALNQVGAIPGAVFDYCKEILGIEGFNAIVFAVGMFKLIGTILNAYNEPVPEYR